MSETPAPPEAAANPTPPAAAGADAPETPATPSTMEGELGKALKEQEVSIRSLLEAGAHFGHQPDPRQRLRRAQSRSDQANKVPPPWNFPCYRHTHPPIILCFCTVLKGRLA